MFFLRRISSTGVPSRHGHKVGPQIRLLSTRARAVLEPLGLSAQTEHFGVYDGEWKGSGPLLESRCPATGEILGYVKSASPSELEAVISRTEEAFWSWRAVPAPRRGVILRQVGDALRNKSDALGALISLEMGKVRTEGRGEVQEFLDICDFGVGLSRRMNGEYVASERPGHTIMEVPNPLGVVGVISAFNFPCAVYGWNLALSFIAGNGTLWKPAPSTPLISVAITRIISKVLEDNGIPGAVASLANGDATIGAGLANSPSVSLVSFTGSERIGRVVSKAVASRFGKVILELGGNNACIIMPDADLSLAVPAVCFGAIGTAGQRCTSTRRLYLHKSIADEFIGRLEAMYKEVEPEDPVLESSTYGPLHSASAVDMYNNTINSLRSSEATILRGGSRFITAGHLREGNFVEPTIVIPQSSADPVFQKETFAPILNVAMFDDLQQAIQWNNSVPQGLSSSLWTRDLQNMGLFIGPSGSDCGIANINVGTSGAEIGAAFGGNKSTGWGRESGGDAWKQYVRWSACTINFGDRLELAQGVRFG